MNGQGTRAQVPQMQHGQHLEHYDNLNTVEVLRRVEILHVAHRHVQPVVWAVVLEIVVVGQRVLKDRMSMK